jgi:uncharacterized membrane protein YdjX (TVP38/TMEM64 family)
MMTRAHWIRIGIAAAVIVALMVVGELTGIRHRVTFVGIRDAVHAAGPWGIAVYVVGFIVLELVHFPGLLFFVTGVLIWGPVRGGLLGAATALVSVSITFALVRAIGGTPEIPERPVFLRKLFLRLRSHPVRTVALLRLVTFMTPTVTYALALSPLRFSEMLLGTFVGLVPAFLIAGAFAEPLLHKFFS